MSKQQLSNRSNILPSGALAGWYDDCNGTHCNNCGLEKPTKLIYKGITNYGVRVVMALRLCRRCEDM